MVNARFLVVVVLLAGCDDGDPSVDAGFDGGFDAGSFIGETVDPATLDLEADPPGEWLAGDLHVHATGASNDTGGDSFPDDIKRVAMERGLYFVVLTDHSNSTGSDPTTRDEDPALFNMGPEFTYWDRAAELSEPGTFLMIDGNEMSPIAAGDPPEGPTGHVGCVPADLATFDRSGAITDRPRGTVTGGETLEQARARGCFSVLNHPWGTPWTSFDWTSFDYDGIEIWNGTAGLDGADENGFDAWRCDWLAGRPIAGIGASDNHRVNQDAPGEVLDPALGFPRTYVFAADRSWDAIVAGMRAGLTAVGEGGSELFLDAYAADGSRSRDAQWIRLRGQLSEEARSVRLTLTRATACADTRADDREPPTLTEELLLERGVEPGTSFDLAIAIDGAAGLYTARLGDTRGHYAAMSNPILVE